MNAQPNGQAPAPLMSPQEVAEVTGVSYDSVLRAIRAGRLRAFKLCGKIRVRVDDFERWAFADPIQPARRAAPPNVEPLRPRRPPARGSVADLEELERSAGA